MFSLSQSFARNCGRRRKRCGACAVDDDTEQRSCMCAGAAAAGDVTGGAHQNNSQTASSSSSSSSSVASAAAAATNSSNSDPDSQYGDAQYQKHPDDYTASLSVLRIPRYTDTAVCLLAGLFSSFLLRVRDHLVYQKSPLIPAALKFCSRLASR